MSRLLVSIGHVHEMIRCVSTYSLEKVGRCNNPAGISEERITALEFIHLFRLLGFWRKGDVEHVKLYEILAHMGVSRRPLILCEF